MSEETLFSDAAGKHFILNFGTYSSFHHDETATFKCVLFYLEIVNKMRQVSNKIYEFNHSIKQPDGRCNNKFI